MRAAVETLYRLLKPGGVVLCDLPGIRPSIRLSGRTNERRLGITVLWSARAVCLRYAYSLRRTSSVEAHERAGGHSVLARPPRPTWCGGAASGKMRFYSDPANSRLLSAYALESGVRGYNHLLEKELFAGHTSRCLVTRRARPRCSKVPAIRLLIESIDPALPSDHRRRGTTRWDLNVPRRHFAEHLRCPCNRHQQSATAPAIDPSAS